MSGLVFTASTVKDTLPNVRRWVARNLAGGVDHMFVFLDAGDPEVRAWLDLHPNVTCVRTGKEWWHGARPAQLNDRQRINANAVNAVLGGLDGDGSGTAGWLFHVDGDEVVQVDRSVLDGLADGVRAVRLGVLEAVARPHWDGAPTWFKRPLSEDELVLLTTLGVLDRPSNGAYFHGHTDGKAGIRPGPGAWLTLHDPVSDDGRAVPCHTDAALRLLHYESWSGEEFVRKWMSLIEAGPLTRFRPGRQPTLVAVRTLLGAGLPAEVTERYLMRVFEETTADDLDTLRELGLLVEVDPDRGAHRPQELDEPTRAALDAALARVAAEPKQRFKPPANRPVDRDGSREGRDGRGGRDGEGGQEPARVRAARRLRRRS